MTGSRRSRLDGRVVVILGASSGVGRAAAEAFAEAGAHLVLAARRADLLEEVRLACEAHGPTVLAIPTDATDASAVRRLADAAIAEFGRIDVWVNNVGVGAVGAFDETPIEAHEQVIRTNLIGHLNGAHAAVRVFKQQGEGVLINTNSLGGWTPAPYAVAYSASKFGLRGYAEALRGELSRYPKIHVCNVFPGFLDTPGISHGANYTGAELRPLPLVKDPTAVAKLMVRLARRPRYSTIVGQSATLARLVHGIAPGPTMWLMARYSELYFRIARPAPRTDGAVFEPMPEGRSVHGGWRRTDLRVVAGAALAAGAGLAFFMVRQRRRAQRA